MEKLEEIGVESIRDIPEGFELTDLSEGRLRA
jgi:hypothetical protein